MGKKFAFCFAGGLEARHGDIQSEVGPVLNAHDTVGTPDQHDQDGEGEEKSAGDDSGVPYP
ncbi:MAG: hypothetical protein ACI82H_000166 [Alphaproteobacteria bacterium]|jgi:hypothetical protein